MYNVTSISDASPHGSRLRCMTTKAKSHR